MSIVDLFSKRQKRLRGDAPDVFTYDRAPNALRVQVIHIWGDAIGDIEASRSQAGSVYKAINDILCREYGVLSLSDDSYDTPFQAVAKFLLTSKHDERVFDVIELSFRCIEKMTQGSYYTSCAHSKITPSQAIGELNARFLEHAVGYQYEAGLLIRKDSELLHSEVVKPTLAFLADKRFQGANGEFLNAHQHYRAGCHKECLNECLKAFESTLKVICDSQGWSYDPGAGAKQLLDLCFKNNLLPALLQSHFSALRNTLESGVPTLRNKLAGHGQGTEEVSIPPYYAGYALHLTASAILFLVQAEGDLK